MKFVFEKKTLRIFGGIISAALFILITFRASNLSITFDEVASIRDASGDIYKAAKKSANTQYLNSVLTRWSSQAFNESIFFYRLPNVLGFALYLWASFSIANQTLGKKYLLGVLLLNSIPFLLDFFSISRGYGLSMAFCLCGIALLIKKRNNIIAISTLATISLILGAMSNLTALNVLLVYTPIIWLKILVSDQSIKRKITSLSCSILALGLFTSFIKPIIISLVEDGDLYFGGREGIFQDTITSTGNVFAYHQGFNNLSIVFISTLFIVALTISITNIILAGKSIQQQIKLHFEWPFLLTLISIELQNLIFETNYPVERTALFLIILTLLVILKGPLKGLTFYTKLVQVPIILIFSLQFIRSVNLNITYSWRFVSGTNEIVNILSKLSPEEQKTITLGIDILVDPTTQFYLQKNKNTHFKVEKINDFWETKPQLEELNHKYYGIDLDKLIPDSKIDDIFQKISQKKYSYLYLLKKETEELKHRKLPYDIVYNYKDADSYLLKYVGE